MGNLANQNWNLAQCSGPGQFGVYLGLLESLFGPVVGSGASFYPDKDGWHDYILDSPPEKALCQFRQTNCPDQVPNTWVGYKADLHPEFNAAYLKWRLTGIAKEQGFNDWSW